MNPQDIKVLAPDSAAALWLLDALSQAAAQERPLRIIIEGDTIAFKVGEGIWSPPYPVPNQTTYKL